MRTRNVCMKITFWWDWGHLYNSLRVCWEEIYCFLDVLLFIWDEVPTTYFISTLCASASIVRFFAPYCHIPTNVLICSSIFWCSWRYVLHCLPQSFFSWLFLPWSCSILGQPLQTLVLGFVGSIFFFPIFAHLLVGNWANLAFKVSSVQLAPISLRKSKFLSCNKH